jgi:amidohydrolase
MEINPSDIEKLIKLRKAIHAEPELAGEEFKTREKVKAFLSANAPPSVFLELGRTGLAAIYDFNNPGPTVLIRSELDALPIAEVNDFEHKSTSAGKGHKCGHDGHSTMLCGTAMLLKTVENFKGRAVLLFQPAEETGEGAKWVIEDKKFEGITPDWVFSLHNLPGFEKSKIVYKENSFTPSVVSIIINIEGKTSHAAEPEHGDNPSLALAEIAFEANKLVINKPNNDDFQLATPIYQRLGSKAYGTSAGEGETHFTLRAWTDKTMQKLKSDIEAIAKKSTDKHNLTVSFQYVDEFFANQNDKEAVQYIVNAAKEVGATSEEKKYPNRWGEDFGLFTQKYKGAMFGLGAGENCPSLHNPDYDFPDEITETGSRMFFTILKSILSNQNVR